MSDKFTLAALHPVVMIPLVFVLWIAGVTILLIFLSSVSFPGLNEHGSGLFLAAAIYLGAVVAAVVNISVNLKRRRLANK